MEKNSLIFDQFSSSIFFNFSEKKISIRFLTVSLELQQINKQVNRIITDIANNSKKKFLNMRQTRIT